MNSSKKILSFFLAIVMVLGLVSPVLATNSSKTGEVKPIELGKKVDREKQTQTFIVKTKDTSKASLFGVRSLQGDSIQPRALRNAGQLTASQEQKINIILKTKGLADGAQDFDWSLFTGNKFTAKVLLKFKDGTDEILKTPITFTTDGQQVVTISIPTEKEVDTYGIVTEFKDNFEVRAYQSEATTTGAGSELTVKFTVTQLPSPILEVKYLDAYGNKLTSNLPTNSLGNLVWEDMELPLPTAAKRINIRNQDELGEDIVAADEFDLNEAGLTIPWAINGSEKGELTDGQDETAKKYSYTIEKDEKTGTKILIVYKEDIIVPPTDDDGKLLPTPEGYARLTFDATAEGKIGQARRVYLDVLKTLTYDNEKLVARLEAIEVKPNKDTKKFNAWVPGIPADQTPVSDEYYIATYVDKDKILDVTNQESEIPEGYERLIFDANTKEGKEPKLTGKIENNQYKAIDVRKDVDFGDKELIAKIDSIKAVADDKTYKFSAWDPEVKKSGKIESVHYNATYVKKDVIVVPDPDKPGTVPDGYVRLTFSGNTADGSLTGKIDEHTNKIIDVLKETNWNEEAVTGQLPKTATPDDNTKKFEKWNKDIPTSGQVEETTFNALYVDKEKFKPVDPDNINNDPDAGYVRLIFDATDKGTINGEEDVRRKAIDVLRNTPYADKELQAEIEKIKAVPKKVTPVIVFNNWSPLVPTENAFVKSGTFTAQYRVDKDVIEDPTGETPDGYVRITFKPTSEGTFASERTQNIGEEKKYDVKNTLKWGQAKADGLVIPTALYQDETKAFKEWNNPLPKDTDLLNENKDFEAVYQNNKDVIPGGSGVEVPEGYHTINFHSGNNGTFKQVQSEDQVLVFHVKDGITWEKAKGEGLKVPVVTPNIGYKVSGETPWSPNITDQDTIKSDLNLTAQYTEEKDFVPGNGDQPEGYVKVTFTTDTEKGDFAEDVTEAQKSYYVNPKKDVILVAPKIVAKKNYIHTGWDNDTLVAQKYESNTVVKATFEVKGDILPGTDTKPEGFVTITFKKGDNGDFAEGVTEAQKSLHVRANKELTIPTPEIKANTGFKFTGWNPDVSQPKTYTTDTDVTAQYQDYGDVVPGSEAKPDGYVTVEFSPGDNGKLVGNTRYYVNPVKIKTIEASQINPPEIKANIGYKVAEPKWNPEFIGTTQISVEKDLQFTAQYSALEGVIPGDQAKPDGYVTITFDAGDHGEFIGATNVEKSFHVNPEKEVTLTEKGNALKAKIKANTGWKFSTWDTNIAESRYYNKDLTIKALYNEEKDVVDVKTPGYVKVTFETETEKGNFVVGDKTYYYVNPEKNVTLAAPGINVVTGYKHTGWKNKKTQEKVDLTKAHIYTRETTITATYEELPNIIEGGDKPAGYLTITLNAGAGKFADQKTSKVLFVKPGTSTSEFEKPVADETTKQFKEWFKNGTKAPETMDEDNVSLSAQYEEKAFDDKNIAKVEVTKMPTKVSYKENETFEVAGMKVTLTDANGNTKTVTADDFATEGIKVAPANGAKLTVAANNEQPIHVTKEIQVKDGVIVKVEADSNEKLTVTAADKMTTPTIVKPVKGDTKVEGTADDGAIVEVKLPNGTTVTATATGGKWTVGTSPLEAGKQISAIAKDPAGKKADSEEKTVTVDNATSKEDVIPYEPSNPSNPTDPKDPKLPGVDNEGNTINKGEFFQVAFVVSPENGGTLSLGKFENKTVIAALVKKTATWENVTMPTYKASDHYAFTKWLKEGAKPAGEVKQGDLVTAVFVTTGDKIDKDQVLPEGWSKVTVSRNSDSIKADDLYGQSYAVENGSKLAAEKFPTPEALSVDFKDPAWYVGEEKVANPADKVIQKDTEFMAKATRADFDNQNIIKIEVTAEPKLVYTAGDKFDPTTMVVTLTDKYGNKDVIEAKDFDEKGISIEPAKDYVLLNTDNDKFVRATKVVDADNGVALVANTKGKLQVTAKALEKTDQPSINPIPAGTKLITGTAEAGATVTIKVDGVVKGSVVAGPDSEYTFTSKENLKLNTEVEVTASAPGKDESEPKKATVGVNKQPLEDAVEAGKAALVDRSDGTPADTALQDAINAGNKVIKDPDARQDQVDQAKADIEKALENKKAYDQAMDKLKEEIANSAKPIKAAKDEEKPEELISAAEQAVKDGQAIVNSNGENKSVEEVIAASKQIVDKLAELMKKEIIPTFDSPGVNQASMVIITNPAVTKIKVTVISGGVKTEYEKNTAPGSGEATINFNQSLKKGDILTFEFTKDGYLPTTLSRPVR